MAYPSIETNSSRTIHSHHFCKPEREPLLPKQMYKLLSESGNLHVYVSQLVTHFGKHMLGEEVDTGATSLFIGQTVNRVNHKVSTMITWNGH